jgi:hypothetical protein
MVDGVVTACCHGDPKENGRRDQREADDDHANSMMTFWLGRQRLVVERKPRDESAAGLND